MSVPSASAAAAPLPELRRHLGPAVFRGRERGGGRPADGGGGAAGGPARSAAASPWGWPAAPVRSKVRGGASGRLGGGRGDGHVSLRGGLEARD